MISFTHKETGLVIEIENLTVDAKYNAKLRIIDKLKDMGFNDDCGNFATYRYNEAYIKAVKTSLGVDSVGGI